MLIKKSVLQSPEPSASAPAEVIESIMNDKLVYSSASGVLSLVVFDDNGFIGYIPFAEDVMRVNSVGRATFLEVWSVTDYSIKEGLERFVVHLNDYGAMYDASGAVKELVKRHGLEDYFSALEQGVKPAVKPAAEGVTVQDGAEVPEKVEGEEPVTDSAAAEAMATIAGIAAGELPASTPAQSVVSAPVEEKQAIVASKTGAVEKPITETKPKETPKMNLNQDNQVAVPEMSRKVGDFQVSVANGQVHIEMGGSKADDGKLATDDFAGKPLVAEPQDELMFYVALDKAKVMQRCVSISVGDRATVGAMIGNWSSEGFLVQAYGSKEMLKMFRALEAAKKQADKAPTDPADGPASTGGGTGSES
jgi:hypothetical protein